MRGPETSPVVSDLGATVSTTVTIVGNVTRDPELRYTNSGVAVTGFGVAVSAREKGDDGEWRDGEPSFYDVTCWRLLAESVAEAVGKGKRVVVTGKLRQSSWEQDGAKRSKVEVVADDVALSVLFAASDGDRPARSAPPAPKYDPTDEPF